MFTHATLLSMQNQAMDALLRAIDVWSIFLWLTFCMLGIIVFIIYEIYSLTRQYKRKYTEREEDEQEHDSK